MKLDYNKVYSKKEYDDIYDTQNYEFSLIKFILTNFKTSLRLFFSDINDIIFQEANIEKIHFDEDKKYLEKIIREQIDVKNKEVIVALVIAPYQKVINFPDSDSEIKYLLIELENSDFFIIDEHPNTKGHLNIAKKLLNLLDKE